MNIRMTLMLLTTAGATHVVVANNIHVCPTCAHTTIQSAVNDAVSNDLITIAAGRYTENVTIEGKSLILQGAAGGLSGVTEVYAAGRGFGGLWIEGVALSSSNTTVKDNIGGQICSSAAGTCTP